MTRTAALVALFMTIAVWAMPAPVVLADPPPPVMVSGATLVSVGAEPVEEGEMTHVVFKIKVGQVWHGFSYHIFWGDWNLLKDHLPGTIISFLDCNGDGVIDPDSYYDGNGNGEQDPTEPCDTSAIGVL